MVRRSTKYLCLAFYDEKRFATLTEADMAAIAVVHAESPDARRAYERALSLTGHEPERRFLEGQLRDS